MLDATKNDEHSKDQDQVASKSNIVQITDLAYPRCPKTRHMTTIWSERCENSKGQNGSFEQTWGKKTWNAAKHCRWRSHATWCQRAGNSAELSPKLRHLATRSWLLKRGFEVRVFQVRFDCCQDTTHEVHSSSNGVRLDLFVLYSDFWTKSLSLSLLFFRIFADLGWLSCSERGRWRRIEQSSRWKMLHMP